MVLCGVKALRFAQQGATSDHSAQIPVELWGKKPSIAALPPSPFFPFSTPIFFPFRKIIHFNRPTPFPLCLPLKPVIKCLTSLHTKRDVFEMQTNKHLGLLRLDALFYELLWQYLVAILSISMQMKKVVGSDNCVGPLCSTVLTIQQINDTQG